MEQNEPEYAELEFCIEAGNTTQAGAPAPLSVFVDVEFFPNGLLSTTVSLGKDPRKDLKIDRCFNDQGILDRFAMVIQAPPEIRWGMPPTYKYFCGQHTVSNIS